LEKISDPNLQDELAKQNSWQKTFLGIITDYVTNKALEGVFKMITVEEKNIGTNLNARASDALKKVFALQDKK
jgi:hypothetical protein